MASPTTGDVVENVGNTAGDLAKTGIVASLLADLANLANDTIEGQLAKIGGGLPNSLIDAGGKALGNNNNGVHNGGSISKFSIILTAVHYQSV